MVQRQADLRDEARLDDPKRAYKVLIADLVKLAAAAGVTPGLWRVIGPR